MKKNKIGLIILIIGIVLVLYPLFSDIIFSVNHSTTISKYEEYVSNASKEELDKIKEESEKYNLKLIDSENESEDNKETSYLNLLNLGDIIGYIKIPKIDVNLPIYQGVSDKVLESGIGHIENTSLPTGKINTHCVLAGHTGLMKSRYFDDIDKLEIGDVFFLTVLDEIYAYSVDQIKVVEPEDSKDLEIVEGEELVTLLTCVPYGVNSHRLLVRGNRIEEENIPEEKLVENKLAKTNPEVQKEIYEKTEKSVITENSNIKYFGIWGVVIFLIIIIIVKIKRKNR